MTKKKPMDKVIITSRPTNCGLYIGEATTEEGVVIGEHASSSIEWSKIDMMKPHNIEQYGKFFPNGFEIIFNGEIIGQATPKETGNE